MAANLSLPFQNSVDINHHSQATLIEEPVGQKADRWMMLAHDLRNPLIAMQRVIEIAIADSQSDNTRDMLAQAHTNCDLLLDMLTDVLDSHRPQTYEKMTGWQETRPAVMVEKCSRLVQALVADKDISLRIDVRPDLPNVIADERSLIRVLTNLIQNALKFTPIGGVIEVIVEECSDYALIFSVKDYGSGIPAEEADRIFDRRYQCASSQAAQEPGYGWGLYYCKTTLEALGGNIWVESSEGGPEKGTVISFTVPTR